MLGLLLATANAASLDLIEVGGVYGTPNTDGPTATWWNPAGFATSEGLQLYAEVAPTVGGVRFDRADPNGGYDEYHTVAQIPFVGVSWDLNRDDVGIGAAFGVPFGRGGESICQDGYESGLMDVFGEGPDDCTDAAGAGRYHMRNGASAAYYTMVGAAWRPLDQVSIGGVLSVVHSRWYAFLDSETLPDLESAVQALGEETVYTDSDLEDPHYASTLETQGFLTDTRMSFALGVKVVPDPEERVSLSLTYHHGVRLEHTGDVRILMGCPPQDDEIGRFGMESYGLCDALIEGDMKVSYRLPSRVHGGVAVTPIEQLRVELMGGWVNWSVYDDFTVEITDVEAQNPGIDPDAADLVEKHQTWARDAQDSVWAALDVKATVAQGWLTLGGRALFDRAALPDHALSANNYDANTLSLTGMAAVHVLPVNLDVILSYGYAVTQVRTVTDSGFDVTLGADRADERWYYPHANGTYTSWTHRGGLGVRWRF
jgi:long-subunit fatty acid transport protein